MTPFGSSGLSARVRAVASDLASDGRGRILFTIAFGWFLGLGVRLSAPTLVPYIRADFGIGLSTAGLLLSTLWFTYALLQFPGGVLGDWIGERAVLVASSALAIVALAASALAWSTLALFAGFVLLGSATGVYATTRFTSLADVYPDRTATAMGVSSAAGNLGTVLLPAGAGVVAGAASWRLGFAAATPLFALAAVGLWVAVPARTSGQESVADDLSADALRRFVAEVTGRQTLVLTAAMLLMSIVYQGFTSFFPTYLVSIKGLSEGSAALLYSAFFASGILVQPLAGVLADSVGDRPTLLGFSFLSASAIALLLATDEVWLLVVLAVLASAQLGFWPIAQAGVVDSLPTEMQGTGFGLLRTGYLLLAATSPTIVGALGDRGRFDEAFVLLAGCALGSALIGLLFWDDG
ncbi:MFS transporter [Halorussus marinus]|uniref:MFS transporter n=1 Tax=Halorussus marinus TaxID=2505976 RepID=UPI00143D0D47|nr:MFS transporter [Halorussus marinus]